MCGNATHSPCVAEKWRIVKKNIERRESRLRNYGELKGTKVTKKTKRREK
jgi:hypothetical protein